MLYRLNTVPGWRRIIGVEEPDLNMKDIEILLRGFAMLIEREEYQSSMVKFLNSFSKNCKKLKDEQIDYLEKLFHSFLNSCSDLPEKAFYRKTTNKFNISIFEAVFVAQCASSFEVRKLVEGKVDPEKLEELKSDSEFVEAIQSQTTSKENVNKRLKKATNILCNQL
jgi:alpha-N-acetylglucosamine transferase